MDQALYDRIQELQRASYFRTTQADGYSRIVDSPFLGAPIASAFERVARFEEPEVEVGRMGVHEVHLACLGFDVVEDDLSDLQKLPLWMREGAITVRRMSGGRC